MEKRVFQNPLTGRKIRMLPNLRLNGTRIATFEAMLARLDRPVEVASDPLREKDPCPLR